MPGKVEPDPHHLLSIMETWKRTSHTNTEEASTAFTQIREMITCKLGREEERLLGDDDPDPRLDEAPTAWREREDGRCSADCEEAIHGLSALDKWSNREPLDCFLLPSCY